MSLVEYASLGSAGKAFLVTVSDGGKGGGVCDVTDVVIPDIFVLHFPSEDLEVAAEDDGDDVSLNLVTSLNVTWCEKRSVEVQVLGL